MAKKKNIVDTRFTIPKSIQEAIQFYVSQHYKLKSDYLELIQEVKKKGYTTRSAKLESQLIHAFSNGCANNSKYLISCLVQFKYEALEKTPLEANIKRIELIYSSFYLQLEGLITDFKDHKYGQNIMPSFGVSISDKWAEGADFSITDKIFDVVLQELKDTNQKVNTLLSLNTPDRKFHDEVNVKKGKNKPTPKILTFADCLTSEYKYLLPLLVSEYEHTKPKQKVLMVAALFQLNVLHDSYASQFKLTFNCITASFGDSGSDKYYTRMIKIKDSNYDIDTSSIKPHKDKITKMMSCKKK